MTGEHLSPDVQQFIRTLHEHRVRYLLVGGEAVIHHGYPRLTGDVDFFYDATALNASRLYAALADFWGTPVPTIAEPKELLEPGVIVQFGRPPNRIDLISTLGTVRSERAWRRRVRDTLQTRRGAVPLPIIGLEDLLESKRDAGRYKDLDDIARLTDARRRRRKRVKRTR